MTKNRSMLLSFAFALAPTCLALADHHSWVSLFDGKTLDGWTQRNGTATYRVEGDSIVGKTAEGSPNSFLCTDKIYSDFELEFEVRVDAALNSGVQIRSRTRGGTPRGRVNGPQVEIEASGEKGAEAGYLYGEAAGGWMTPEEKRKPHKHFKDGEWNKYRVVAQGTKIQVWINDAMISDLVDTEKYRTHPRGFIGLQVHGVRKGSGPYDVAWRNLRIRELPGGDVDGWVTLYNGKDLDGWKTTGNWLPQDDGSVLIHPRPGEKGWQRYDAYLWSEKKYKDFVLDVEYTYPPKGNSGIYFRVRDVNDPVKTGIEAQILDSSKHEGEMTHHDHGGIIGTIGATKNVSNAPGEWNRMIITCVGPHLQVELNDEKIIDVQIDKTPIKDRPPEGYIGLQDHGEPNNLKFRNIRVKEL
jgi:hypothetical protein